MRALTPDAGYVVAAAVEDDVLVISEILRFFEIGLEVVNFALIWVTFFAGTMTDVVSAAAAEFLVFPEVFSLLFYYFCGDLLLLFNF